MRLMFNDHLYPYMYVLKLLLPYEFKLSISSVIKVNNKA